MYAYTYQPKDIISYRQLRDENPLFSNSCQVWPGCLFRRGFYTRRLSLLIWFVIGHKPFMLVGLSDLLDVLPLFKGCAYYGLSTCCINQGENCCGDGGNEELIGTCSIVHTFDEHAIFCDDTMNFLCYVCFCKSDLVTSS